jgi:glycosyltransferase involved in cell wall biosynthesis
VKNIPAVLHAFAGIARQVPANLVMVGDGPEQWQAQELARSLDLESQVFFLGLQDGMEALLPLADLFLLPSRHESFGLVALEAMACGVPVIATSRGGTGELIEHGVSGTLVDPDDVAAMIDHGARLLLDTDFHCRIANGGRARAEALFGQDAVVDRYETLYRELLDGRLSGSPDPVRAA